MEENSLTSICSQASAALVSPSSPVVSKPSALSSATQSSASCSVIGGLPSQSFPTLETPNRSESFASRMERLMSLRQGFLVNLRQLSESSVELLMSVGCGPRQSDSFACYDPASSSLRTHQRSLLSNEGEHGTELCQSWSRAGMICNGMYFPLERLVQGIDGNGSSLSLPTPDTQPHRQNPNANAKKWGGNNSVGSYCAANFLPTPVVNDAAKRGEAYLFEKRDKTSFGLNLPRTVASEMLPTPRAGKHTSETEESWSKRNEAGKVSTKPLALAVMSMLPTPKASMSGPDYARAEKRKKTHGSGGDDLVTHLAKNFLPTPTARDYKDTQGMKIETGGGQDEKRPTSPPDLRGRVRDFGNGFPWWHEINTGVPVLASGLPNKLVEGATKCIGDSVVPQAVAPVAKAIFEALSQ